VPVSTSDREEDEDANLMIEDLRKLRLHKKIDRNSKLAREAKRIHGTTCMLCGFNFEAFYGQLGEGFIEAHHLQTLSNLKNEKLLLSPKMILLFFVLTVIG
jgi:5-methylcytosine-specific restriction protein A